MVQDQSSDRFDLYRRMLEKDGYFAALGCLPTDLMDRLSESFDQLEKKQLHPVFAFVFDETWSTMTLLQSLFQSILGEHLFLPAVWSWFVKPESQTAFPPHRDQVHDLLVDDLEHLDYLTVWIPLTDLDYRSSSICLLPASADADFEEGVPDIRVENLQDVRCLQGPRGSVFSWSTQVAHWGTAQSEFGPPRKSIGYYIQRPEAKIIDGPPIDFSQPIPLKQRLAIIGQQIIDYSRTATPQELEFAAELVALIG